MPKLDPTRIYRVTASNAPTIVSGKSADLQRLYLRMTGDPRYVDDRFGETWAARYGLTIEKLAKRWIQEHGYELRDMGKQYFHPERAWCSATIDCRVIRRHGVPCNCALDVKAINAFRDTEEAGNDYAAQLLVQKECAQTDETSLLIVRGGAQPFEFPIDIDEGYRAAVWAAIDQFWWCVENLVPPVPLRFPRIVPPSRWRRIDLDADTDQPNWAGDMRQLLDGWAATEESAKTFEQYKADIKSLFPDDCGRLTCGPYIVKRAMNNSVSIKRRHM